MSPIKRLVEKLTSNISAFLAESASQRACTSRQWRSSRHYLIGPDLIQRFPLAFLEDQTQWRAVKIESLSQSVFQEPLVREMNGFWIVAKKSEGWRSASHLSHIVDFDLLAFTVHPRRVGARRH